MNVQGKIGIALQESGATSPVPGENLRWACGGLLKAVPDGLLGVIAFGEPGTDDIEDLMEALPEMFIAMMDIANAITRVTGRPFNLEQMALEKCRES